MIYDTIREYMRNTVNALSGFADRCHKKMPQICDTTPAASQHLIGPAHEKKYFA
jgi:hypothetical protein